MSRSLSAFLVLLVACDPVKVDDTGGGDVGGADQVDADGDGFSVDEDCDDADGAVNPAADELCNGVDDDCDDEVDEVDAVDAGTWYPDADGDGFGVEDGATTACAAPAGTVPNAEDCDDTDGAVNPDADEVCGDAVDNDCDGGIDDGNAVDASVWYPDDDGDEYGALDAPVMACEQPDGTLGYAGDCDDSDADINPEGTERCNGADDDCDGFVDEDDAVDAGTFYTDGDGDGFGDEASPVTACEAPSGATETGGDCDDSEASVNPAAEEVCLDGLDNDCDGTANTCRLLGEVDDTAAATATWTGEVSGDNAGYALTFAGDMDGDGVADAAIGAFGNDGGGSNAGRVYLVYGGASVAGGGMASLPAVTGAAASDKAGFAVDAAGDVDGDGFDDVLISAYGADGNAGAAWLLPGGSRATGQVDIGTVGWSIAGAAAGDNAGSGLTGAGDLDGDGYDDVLIGARYAGGDDGAVYLVYGSASGWSDLSSVADADASFTGTEADALPGERFTLSGAGDLDGDGLADLAIGAPQSSAGSTRGGAVYLWHGVTSGFSGAYDLTAADTELRGPVQARAGWAVEAGGDADGDGYDDVLIGGYGWDDGDGVLYLWRGSASVSSTAALRSAADLVLEGSTDGSLGRTVAFADLDGDGRADISAAAPYDDSGASNGGAVYVVYGAATMSGSLDAETDADAIVRGTTTNGALGWDLAAGGDLDDDGAADLLIGAFGAGTYAGEAMLVPGSGL